MFKAAKILCRILVLVSVLSVKADLTRAYSFFLIEEYDSAYYYYDKALEMDSTHVDAWAGKMDCLLYQKKYDESIAVGTMGLQVKESFLLHHKMAYLYALENKSKSVDYHYEKARAIPENEQGSATEDQVKSMILSIGYGYLYGGNKNSAVKWFTMGKVQYDNNNDFVAALDESDNVQQLKLNYYFININGGKIDYSGSDYYDNGYFFTINPSLTLTRNHFISFVYNQSDINVKQNVPYSYVTKMYYTRPDIPKEERGYAFEEKIFPVGGGRYDTVYYVDVPVDPKTYQGSLPISVAKYNPDNLWTKEFSLQYKLLYSPINKTSLLAGFRYSLSNMLYSEKTYTAYFGHFTKFSTVSIGGLYFGTSLDSVDVLQISPSISTLNKNLNVELQVYNIIRLTDINTVYNWLPPYQLSTDATVSYHGSKGSASLTAQTGQRAFAMESYGVFFRNSYSPFILGTKVLLEFKPFQIPLTMYYLFSFSKYTGYKSYVSMGGLHYQW